MTFAIVEYARYQEEGAYRLAINEKIDEGWIFLVLDRGCACVDHYRINNYWFNVNIRSPSGIHDVKIPAEPGIYEISDKKPKLSYNVTKLA